MQSLIWAIFFTLLSSLLGAQSVTISVQQESISFPFSRFEQWNSGAEIGYQFASQQREHGFRQIGLALGYFFHRDLHNACYLKVTYTFSWKLWRNIHFHMMPSVGYMHSFHDGDIYVLKAGNYVAKKQLGRPHLWLDNGIGFSFFQEQSISPFVQYRFALETPFASGIPFLPHSFYQLGLQYKL